MDDRFRLLTVAEAAERLGIPPLGVYRLTWTGGLPTVRIGAKRGAVRIREIDLAAWLDANTAVAA